MHEVGKRDIIELLISYEKNSFIVTRIEKTNYITYNKCVAAITMKVEKYSNTHDQSKDFKKSFHVLSEQSTQTNTTEDIPLVYPMQVIGKVPTFVLVVTVRPVSIESRLAHP